MDILTRHPTTRRRASRMGRTAAEIDAAILLVTTGGARSVRLSGLPGAARIAATAAEHARDAGVGFQVERGDAGEVLCIGPKMPG